jgi:hypothetical protein
MVSPIKGVNAVMNADYESVGEIGQEKVSPREARVKSHIFQARVLYCLVALTLVAGCVTGTQEFRHPEADLSSIQRVAVVPFENYTGTQFAAEKVTTTYITELLINIEVEVVEPGEVSRVLRESNITGGKLSQDDIRKIGNSLKADTLIFGAVLEYGQERVRNETYPIVSLNVRWVDVNTGTIIFMGTASAEGSPKVPVIDVGEEQLFSVLTQRVCHKLITTVR